MTNNFIYRKEFGSSLKDAVGAKTAGNFRKMLLLMLEGKRNKFDGYDMKFAAANAEVMCGNGGTNFGMNEDAFSAILATESFDQLRRIFDEYQKVSKQTMHQGIRYSMSGGIAKAMLAIGENN